MRTVDQVNCVPLYAEKKTGNKKADLDSDLSVSVSLDGDAAERHAQLVGDLLGKLSQRAWTIRYSVTQRAHGHVSDGGETTWRVQSDVVG